jgi:dolichyl-phosphate beta-glucosyltransferase
MVVEGKMTFLSIIIPAYNEESRLPSSLEKIDAFIRHCSFRTEVIVVNDGSSDQTSEVVHRFQEKKSYIKLIDTQHGGKGHAVRVGMLKAEGEYLFLADSDLSMPVDELPKFLPPALEGYDIAIASREIAGAVRYGEPAFRHLIGRVFNMLVRVLAVRGIRDTQAGFKCFRRQAARRLFSLQTIDGWGFDVEILMLAQKRNMKIVEVPIHWYYNADSRVQPGRDAYRMFMEVLKVHRNARNGVYKKKDDQFQRLSTVKEANYFSQKD